MSALIFAHVTALAIWLGSLVFVFVFFLILRKQLFSIESRQLFVKLTRVFNMLSHISSTVVLVTGIIMLMKEYGSSLGSEPSYIKFMEQVGGLSVLLSIIGLTFLGRRITKQLTAKENHGDIKGFTPYLTTMVGSIALIVSVLFIVAGHM